MFCPNCGTNLSDQAKFCPNCGATTSANPAPSAPVYSAPVYAAPTTPVYVMPGTPVSPLVTERPKKLNLLALIFLAVCATAWLIMPFMAYYSGYYYDYVGGPAVEMITQDYFWEELFCCLPIGLVVLTSFTFIGLGILFTCLKKMTTVRIMGIVNSAFTATMFLVQAITEDRFMEYLHVGFYLVFASMFALIFVSKDMYAD